MPKRKCLKCGVNVLETEETCWSCGALMPGAQPLPPVSEDPPAKSKYHPRAHRASELTAPTEGLLSIWAHQVVSSLGYVVGFSVGVMVGVRLADWVPLAGGWLGDVVTPMAFIGPIVAGLAFVWLIMTYWVTARCPECGGQAVLQGFGESSYRCRRCGERSGLRFWQ